jgi:hypothetical protein
MPSPRAKEPVKGQRVVVGDGGAAMTAAGGRPTSPAGCGDVGPRVGSKAGTANRRTVPETPSAIASGALLAPPSVRYARRHGRFSFTPA